MPEAQQSINNNVDKPIVDIDTSGPSVNVAVEEKKEEDNVEVEQDTTIQEVKTTQQSKDELDTVSEGVQKRIDRLTWKVREAERREKAATQYAKSVQHKLKENENKVQQLDEGYVNEFKTRVESQIASAKNHLKLAIDAGDSEKQTEAQTILAQLAVDQNKLRSLESQKAQIDNIKKEVPVNPQTAAPIQQPIAPPPDPKAQSWAQKNSWFGKDDAMTYTAYSLHKKLTEQEGFDPNSDEYYSEIDNRIRKEFPHKFGDNTTSSDRPVQAVASASRTSSKSGRKTVKLSPSQVAIAKKLGVSLQEYAKYVKE